MTQSHTECRICLQPNDTTKEEIAALSGCTHHFHHCCIESWSGITNKCPLCNTRFSFILLMSSNQKIEIVDKQQRNDLTDLSLDEMDIDAKWNAMTCSVCNDPKDEHLTLICDCCQKCYHTFCIGLASVPSCDPWFCDQCSDALNLHQCTKCGKSFDREADLKIHERSVHSKKRPFECKHCKKKFKTKNNRSHHIRAVHDKIKNHKCMQCKAKFYKRADLISHQRVHSGEKPFECKAKNCRMRFATSSNRTRHYKRMHKECD